MLSSFLTVVIVAVTPVGNWSVPLEWHFHTFGIFFHSSSWKTVEEPYWSVFYHQTWRFFLSFFSFQKSHTRGLVTVEYREDLEGMPAPISVQLPPKLATSSLTFSLAGSLHVSVEHQHYKNNNNATATTTTTNEEVVNPKSLWRQPLAVRARRLVEAFQLLLILLFLLSVWYVVDVVWLCSEKIDGLVIDSMPAERGLKNISCFVAHNVSSTSLIG